MSVVVTGATGGLGLSLVEALVAQGRQVVAIGRRAPVDARLNAPGVTYRAIDLSDRVSATLAIPEGTGTVFHCAAMTGTWGPLSTFRRNNVDTTRNVAWAAAHAGVRTFVHVSSPSIYAAMRDRVGIVEEDDPADPPLGHYARTKLESEIVALETDGPMRVIAVRPRGIVGPDDAVVLPRLIEIVGRKRVPVVRGGRALVEMIDVRDAVSALLAAEAHADVAHGQAVNVSGGSPMPVIEIARRLADALGRSPRFDDVPLGIARAVAGLTDALWPEGGAFGEPKLTPYSLATLAYSQTFDLTRARTLLGWEPRHDAVATLIDHARRSA